MTRHFVPALLLSALAALACGGSDSRDGAGTFTVGERPPRVARPVGPSPVRDDETARRLREDCGVEIVSLKLTARGGMVEVRYLVADLGVAREAFHGKIALEFDGEDLAVADVIKIGALRAKPRAEGKLHYILFGIAGRTISPGDAVALRIGERRYDGLVVGGAPAGAAGRTRTVRGDEPLG